MRISPVIFRHSALPRDKCAGESIHRPSCLLPLACGDGCGNELAGATEQIGGTLGVLERFPKVADRLDRIGDGFDITDADRDVFGGCFRLCSLARFRSMYRLVAEKNGLRGTCHLRLTSGFRLANSVVSHHTLANGKFVSDVLLELGAHDLANRLCGRLPYLVDALLDLIDAAQVRRRTDGEFDFIVVGHVQRCGFSGSNAARGVSISAERCDEGVCLVERATCNGPLALEREVDQVGGDPVSHAQFLDGARTQREDAATVARRAGERGCQIAATGGANESPEIERRFYGWCVVAASRTSAAETATTDGCGDREFFTSASVSANAEGPSTSDLGQFPFCQDGGHCFAAKFPSAEIRPACDAEHDRIEHAFPESVVRQRDALPPNCSDDPAKKSDDTVPNADTLGESDARHLRQARTLFDHLLVAAG